MDEIRHFDYKNIYDYIKVTGEYTFVDKVDAIPGKEAWGTKLSSMQDWYYRMHFPGNPIMPGVFLIEMLQTTASLIIYSMEGKKDIQLLFHGVKNMRMYHSVRPGDVVKSHITLDGYRLGIASFTGDAYVDDKLICKAEFTLVAPEEIPRRLKTDE